MSSIFFFFNDTATTEIYTLSLHDALPISYLLPVIPASEECLLVPFYVRGIPVGTIWAIMHNDRRQFDAEDRKSTRLNSSHSQISYAVFCLKKKKESMQTFTTRQRPSLQIR